MHILLCLNMHILNTQQCNVSSFKFIIKWSASVFKLHPCSYWINNTFFIKYRIFMKIFFIKNIKNNHNNNNNSHFQRVILYIKQIS